MSKVHTEATFDAAIDLVGNRGWVEAVRLLGAKRVATFRGLSESREITA